MADPSQTPTSGPGSKDNPEHPELSSTPTPVELAAANDPTVITTPISAQIQATRLADPIPATAIPDSPESPLSFESLKEKNSDPETGTAVPRKRTTWERINPLKRSKVIPVPDVPEPSQEPNANIFSKIGFWWVQPLMTIGYNRHLEANDLWEVPPKRAVEGMSEQLLKNYNARKKAISYRPLLMALYDTYKRDIILGGLGSLVASMVMALGPFVQKYILTFVTAAYAHAHDPSIPKEHIGHGIGPVAAVLVLLLIQSISSNQHFYRSAMVGSQARASLTVLIFEKAMRLSGRARAGTTPLLDNKPDFAPGSKDEKKWLANQLKKNTKAEKLKKKKEKDQEDAAQKRIQDAEKRRKAGAPPKKAPPPSEVTAGWANGKIVNLMSTDTHRIELACGTMHFSWSSPAAVVVTIVLLLINLNYSALPGIALFFVSVPLLGRMMKAMFSRRQDINIRTESRVNLTQEILQAVRFVKMFAWEKSFADRLDAVRKIEIEGIRSLLTARNTINAIGISMPVFAAMLSFITYSMTGHSLNPAPVFSSLGLFNSLRMPMNMLPMVLGQVIDALAAVERIEEFLEAEDGGAGPDAPTDAGVAVQLKDASFTWEQNNNADRSSTTNPNEKSSAIKVSEKLSSKETVTASDASTGPSEEPFQLNGITLSFKPDELVAIVGSVGSGKTSLLAAISGEMRQTGGHLAVSRPRALCPQPAWVEHATVRENITFGAPYIEDAYNRVVYAAGLEPDMAQLPNGDQTEIGERGITLSGGQRQRIGVARAAYARIVGVSLIKDSVPVPATVLLLDDPLAAVDAHVGRHIFDNAIVGLLQGSCRVLATHQLWVLPRCDRIVWLQDGSVTAFGTLQQLRDEYPEFNELVSSSVDAPVEKVVQPLAIMKRKPDADLVTDQDKAALMSTEDRATDGVDFKIYVDMFRRAGSVWLAPGIIFLLIVAMGINVLSGLWLAWWSSKTFHINDSVFAGVYAAFGFAQALSLFAFAGSISWSVTRASRALLSAAFRHVLHAPVSFFDTTPLGRITNRFAKDVDVLDNNISDAARTFLLTAGMILATMILAIAYFPPFAAGMGAAAVAIVIATAVFRASSREIRRHESVLRSTVFARFSEGVAGVATVRAYGSQQRVFASLREAVDRVDSATYLSTASQRWLAVRLDFVGFVLVLVSTILVMVRREHVKPSISGLVMSYTFVIAQMLQFSVRQMSEVETAMTAAERVMFYATELPQESEDELPGVPDLWPTKGEIEFQNFSMRYRDGLPLVLKNLDLVVKSGERLALVGRTGAGKSSILSALFRLVDPAQGKILIDGMDVRSVGLHQLRSRLAIIPQDPVLFRGDVRLNLDPFGVHDDKHLWLALSQSGLSGADSSASLHLDDKVDEGGDNFSLGQRQLLSLARALVRTEARVVVCDEATSSVDIETDQRVQKTMMSCFGKGSKGNDDADGAIAAQDSEYGGPRTLITIAHRLRTVIGYDRVCVLQAGSIIELATPLELFDAEGGVFRSMCERSGITREHVLAAAADPTTLVFDAAVKTPVGAMTPAGIATPAALD